MKVFVLVLVLYSEYSMPTIYNIQVALVTSASKIVLYSEYCAPRTCMYTRTPVDDFKYIIDSSAY
jgi:hypothetical protein